MGSNESILVRGPFFKKGYPLVIAKLVANLAHLDCRERKTNKNVEQKGRLKKKGKRKEGRKEGRKKKGQMKEKNRSNGSIIYLAYCMKVHNNSCLVYACLHQI